MDPLLAKMLGLSLIGHALLWGAEPLLSRGGHRAPLGRPLQLMPAGQTVHDRQDRASARVEQAVRESVAEASRLSTGASAASTMGGLGAGRLSLSASIGTQGLHGASAVHPGSSWTAGLSAFHSARSGLWTTAIDLTNITLAAQGNPVLLSYFGAIREQIQRVANGGTWVSGLGQTGGGVVYIGFVIAPTGAVQSASVIMDRSVQLSGLQAAALRIVRLSGPFPPFPPSIASAEDAIALTIPIEFVESP